MAKKKMHIHSVFHYKILGLLIAKQETRMAQIVFLIMEIFKYAKMPI